MPDLHSFLLSDYPYMLSLLASGQIVPVDDVAHLPPQAEKSKMVAQYLDLQAALFIPIFIDDALAGVIALGNRLPRPWNDEDISLLHTLSGVFASSIKRARAEEAEYQARQESIRLYQEALYLSNTDPLTGLYNRRRFFEIVRQEIDRLRRFNQPFSLIILDIDHFKAVNDTYGHLAGDLALNNIAQHLKDSLRAIDSIARFGGEEFIILLPQTDASEAYLAANDSAKAWMNCRYSITGLPFTLPSAWA